ncbi:aminotransferase class V-fold PLP-dependent enzyme [Halosimplex marinum]|uniref:aminotransferase class V-fold PLP-dependent enzyme n=1 Tax=Halosimplex marinum TaxID=3396620 RepID=UPI003F564765
MGDSHPATDVYEELGVPTVVNAAGTKTRIGGSLIRDEAVEAMAAAAESFVRISDLQARASELIAEATGAEAGFVSSGAAAGLELAAAACIAGDDPSAMARLPDTEGVASDVVMPRTHRTGYDHALRAAGADVVDVGTNDRRLGTGATDVEPWELDAAIDEETAAVAVVQKEYTRPSLRSVVEVAHDNDVPVIVDAAAELPPVANLERFVADGADLVVFSGGKAVRGPQSTGIVAGREDLVGSVAMQQLDMHAEPSVWEPPEGIFGGIEIEGVPRQGIGRSLKVGKEELVGLLRALELFVEADHDALAAAWRERAETASAALSEIEGLSTTVEGGAKSVAPEVVVTVDPDAAGTTAEAVVRTLRREDPRVFVGADDVAEGRFGVNPMCLDDGELEYVLERVRAAVET